MKRQLVWMIATILAICGTMTQTSCFSYEDEPVLDPNPQAQTLEGVWYTAYEAEGTIANPNREGDISYTHVVETYEFRNSNKSRFVGNTIKLMILTLL